MLCLNPNPIDHIVIKTIVATLPLKKNINNNASIATMLPIFSKVLFFTPFEQSIDDKTKIGIGTIVIILIATDINVISPTI